MPTIRPFEGLRGICALLVVLFHFGRLESDLVSGSYLFVDVFFILSGYIMMLNYGGKIVDARSALDFLVKRLARVYPLFLFTTATFLAARHFDGVASPAPAHAVEAAAPIAKALAWLTLTSSMGQFDQLYLNNPAWSISTEFWAYVVFAVLAVACRRKFSAAAAVLAVAGLAAAASVSVGSHACLARGECLNVTYDAGFLRCAGGFFLGVLAFKLNAFLALRRRFVAAIRLDAALLGLLFWIVYESTSVHAVAFAMPLTAAALVTVLPLGGPVAQLLGSKPMLWLGRMSFSVYLGHTTVLALMGALPSISLAAGLAVYLGGVLTFAVLANRFVEEPARRLVVGWLGKRKVRHAQPPRILITLDA